LPHRRLDLDQVDHGAGLHAARPGMAEAQDLNRMAAAPQHLARRLRGQARDQAGDLAGADVERRRPGAIGRILGVTP
jgi:hypothetical protein